MRLVFATSCKEELSNASYKIDTLKRDKQDVADSSKEEFSTIYKFLFLSLESNLIYAIYQDIFIFSVTALGEQTF